MKSLNELAIDYDNAIKDVEAIVTETRIKMKKARLSSDSDEYKRLAFKLAVLYEEIRDMRIISEKLKTYYDDEIMQEAV